MDELTLFLVEDEKEVREGLRYLLNMDQEIRVRRTFASAEELLAELATGRRAEIVLMDIGLPGINGIEAAEKIRQSYPDIKVVILTVFEEQEKIVRAIEAGAAGYVLKNTKPALLVEQLKTIRSGGAPISPAAAGKLFASLQRDETAAAAGSYNLTPREREVLKGIAEGYTYKEIAEQHHISSATVKKHILHIYRKLNVSSKVEFMKKVFRENLI